MVTNKNTSTRTGKHWHGVASKTKGTEMRADYIHETISWIVPVGGIATEQTRWNETVLNGMLKVGMRPTDVYLIPYPAVVRAQRRPPGAAEHTEWINHVRRALTAIGCTPEQAATSAGHNAKRTMLTLLNTSGLIKTDQEQQAAGYHRSKGPGTTARRYTLNEMAGPVRCIDKVCQAIVDRKSHPDRPPSRELDTTEVVLEPIWDEHRRPQVSSPVPGGESNTFSDDEACMDTIHDVQNDETAADWLDTMTVTANNPDSKKQGTIFSRMRGKSTKPLQYLVAVNYDGVPDHIVGCKIETKRASIVVYGGGGGNTSCTM